MPQFIDVHRSGVTVEALREVHAAALAATQGEGVHFIQTWADPESGRVFCLSDAPSAEAVQRVHERAGYTPDEILRLTLETPETLGTATTPDGSTLELQRNGDDYAIRAEGYGLMTSRAHGSEDAMMTIARPEPPPGACVLIGGLGMGYTLAATLSVLDQRSSVVVVELIPEIIEWNRGPLGPLAGNPLDDPRVEVVQGDVCAIIESSHDRFDAILLDVDNGPDSPTDRGNSALYTLEGLASARRALRPGGALAVWSVGDEPDVELPENAAFEDRLTAAGFEASTHVAGHGQRGRTHLVFVGRRD